MKGDLKMEDPKFYDQEHEQFYKSKTESKKLDSYNKSLIYLLGLTSETRNNFNKLYEDIAREIKFEGLRQPWQTGTTMAITKLAFNLFNGFCGLEDEEARQYTPENIFCYKEFAPYFYEAIKIRFNIQ